MSKDSKSKSKKSGSKGSKKKLDLLDTTKTTEVTEEATAESVTETSEPRVSKSQSMGKLTNRNNYPVGISYAGDTIFCPPRAQVKPVVKEELGKLPIGIVFTADKTE